MAVKVVIGMFRDIPVLGMVKTVTVGAVVSWTIAVVKVRSAPFARLAEASADFTL